MFKQSLSSRARYILGRVNKLATTHPDRNAFSIALLFPICTRETLEILLRLPGFLAYCEPEAGGPGTRLPAPEIPKRLFRNLRPRVRRGIPVPWSDEDEPLPFLRYLFYLHNTRGVIAGPPKCGLYGSCALTKAVVAGFVPLVKFLLRNGGDPGVKSDILVLAAIQKKDLPMLRLLVEGDPDNSTGAKRRRVSDRIACTRTMLGRAVRVEAHDIIRYLIAKGVTPDLQTLQLLPLDRA